VSTPSGSYLNVTLPPEISVDMADKLHCKGLLMLENNISCSFDGKDTIQF